MSKNLRKLIPMPKRPPTEAGKEAFKEWRKQYMRAWRLKQRAFRVRVTNEVIFPENTDKINALIESTGNSLDEFSEEEEKIEYLLKHWIIYRIDSRFKEPKFRYHQASRRTNPHERPDKKVTFYIPSDLQTRLYKFSVDQNLPQNEIVNLALERFFGTTRTMFEIRPEAIRFDQKHICTMDIVYSHYKKIKQLTLQTKKSMSNAIEQAIRDMLAYSDHYPQINTDTRKSYGQKPKQ